MTTSTRVPVAVSAAACCVLLSACGSSAKAAPAAVAVSKSTTAAHKITGIDPCSLLSDADAAAALGGPATHESVPPKDATIAQVKVTENRCSYQLVTSDQLGHQIYVAVFDGADRSYYDQTSDSHDFSPIQGLGDAATGNAGEVHVFSKGVALEIYGSLPADDGMQHVAAVAIANL